ncbi:MAG: hypothetical protein ACPLXP_00765 [Microgenomates group bacterium]
MHRTQIYFPEELHQDLLIGAKMNNLTLSAYIRKILTDKLYALPIAGRKKKIKKRANPLVIAKYAINLGPRDLAKNFDKYFEKSLK